MPTADVCRSDPDWMRRREAYRRDQYQRFLAKGCTPRKADLLASEKTWKRFGGSGY